ncbi:hypothetical protein L6Q96_23265, partial [Candidatus Binatia bacterium]|nr:hypothetical protein [Candidatus Binatia bacterium]
PLLRGESSWRDVRVAANGTVFVVGPGKLYVIDPVRLRVARQMEFDETGCTASESGCTSGGGPILLALAPCQSATPAPTATATPAPTASSTATPPPTPTATGTPTRTATAVPTTTPTRTATTGNGDGCTLAGGTTTSPTGAWLLLGAAALFWLTRRPRRGGQLAFGQSALAMTHLDVSGTRVLFVDSQEQIADQLFLLDMNSF